MRWRYKAIGPLFLGPLSEVHGRNVMYRISYFLFFVFSWPTAFPPNLSECILASISLHIPIMVLQRSFWSSGLYLESEARPSSLYAAGVSATFLRNQKSHGKCLTCAVVEHKLSRNNSVGPWPYGRPHPLQALQMLHVSARACAATSKRAKSHT